MKKLLLFFALLGALQSCTPESKSSLQKNKSEEDTLRYSRLKNKMFVLGSDYKSTASVAYLLLEDGTVLVYKQNSTDAPLTEEAARIIMQNTSRPLYHSATLVANPVQKGIRKILLATGVDYKSEATVTYLLYPDNSVIICNNARTDAPFTAEEARVVMTDIGTVIAY